MGVVLISLAQLAVSIILAAIAAYLGIWLFERATRHIDEWKEIRQGNLAIGLTLAAVVVGLAIILRPAVAGALPTVGGRLSPDLAAGVLPMYVLLIILVRALLGLVLGIAAILFAIWLFLHLTNELDEMGELSKGNTAVATMLAGVIIAIALLVSPVVTGITDWLLPVFLP
jgi:uncharacterized membrane protein YjfL (UPF0719 family)